MMIPLENYQEYPPTEMQERAVAFYEEVRRRRSVRTFSSRSVPGGVVEDCLRAAGTSPSGANQQPWHFSVVRNSAIKKTIREAAEAEEREFYERRAPREWLDELSAIGTTADKPFLESAPCLVAIFASGSSQHEDGSTRKHYYAKESVGIATGILITALHRAGLVTLTHTPSPMAFLNKILRRPETEKPFLLLVVGYPEESTEVPNLKRKQLEEFATFFD